MKVSYSCPYVPSEIIAAHGLEPCRVLAKCGAGAGPLETAEGMCCYSRDAVNTACSEPDTVAIILTTVCDHMRRAGEIVEKSSHVAVFLMNVPSTWKTAAARRLYVSEIERLGRFLAKLGGRPPSRQRLASVMADYQKRRAELLASRAGVSAVEFSHRIIRFNSTGKLEPVESGFKRRAGLLPVALLGGPLRACDLVLFDMAAESGGEVVLDGTETGERTMPGRFDGRRLRSDPLGELANAYFGSIPDAFRRPNSELYAWLERVIREREVKALILVRHLWCDIWHAEFGRLREWLKIPIVDIDLGEQGPALRDSGRIRALMETAA